MSSTLSRVMTCRDMKLIVAGRTLGTIKEITFEGDSGLADASVLSKHYKQHVKTKNEFSGTWTQLIADMEALGLVLGDYEVDPSKTESINMTFNGASYDIKHIQGTHAADISVAGTQKVAQKFIAAGNTLSALKLYTTTGGDASCTVTIETDNSGSPSGTPVTNGTASGVDFSGSGWITVTFSSDPVLVKGDPFWIVVSVPSTTTPISRSTTDYYEDWGYKTYTGSWSSLEDNDLALQLTTTDNDTVLQIELTDGVNTHIIEGIIGVGSGSCTITLDEPLTAEVTYSAKTITFSG